MTCVLIARWRSEHCLLEAHLALVHGEAQFHAALGEFELDFVPKGPDPLQQAGNMVVHGCPWASPAGVSSARWPMIGLRAAGP
jgi:hypothetical protein